MKHYTSNVVFNRDNPAGLLLVKRSFRLLSSKGMRNHMNYPIAALSATLTILAGCSTNMGHGKHLHVTTDSGILLSQLSYNHEEQCSAHVRDFWARPISDGDGKIGTTESAESAGAVGRVKGRGAGIVKRCSENDLSVKLPYRIADIKSDYLMAPKDLFFASTELCTAAVEELQREQRKNWNIHSFVNRCSVPSGSNLSK